jgi:hypothetical protein
VKEGKETVDQRQNNRRRKVRRPDCVAEIATEVEIDRQTTIRLLTATHGVCMRTIQLTLNADLDLSEKSARWVPKQLTSCPQGGENRDQQKVFGNGSPPLYGDADSIIMMDESAVSFPTPELKMQSKQRTALTDQSQGP